MKAAAVLLIVAALVLGLSPLFTGAAFAGQWLLGVVCAAVALALAFRACVQEEGR